MATVTSAFGASATATAKFDDVRLNAAFSASATAQANFSSHIVKTSGFPYRQLGLKVEILLNGTWTDITKYVMVRDNIVIVAGRTDESSGMQPGQMTLTLKNTDGRFTPNNTSGAYYPYVQLNTRLRLSVNDQSTTGINYVGTRFWGEVSEWPPLWDPSGRDVSVPITVSGIWRRISQSTKTIGSPFTRWNTQLSKSFTYAGYWPMEDGQNATNFATVIPATSSPMTITPKNGVPTLASCTAFPGSDALPQLNGAEFIGSINTSVSPTTIAFRFSLFVQSGGDTGAAAGVIARLNLGTSTSLHFVDVGLGPAGGGPLTITGYDSGNHVQFTSTLSDVVWGKPIMVQVGLVKSGSNVIWSLNTILPNTTTWYGTTTGTVNSVSLVDSTGIIFNLLSGFKGVAVGQAAVIYGNPSITSDASALGGWNGENAITRFKRICAEQSIPVESIGSTSTAMGPQVDDTLVNVLQSIEDTDGGFIYETQDQFGLGYRSMSSLQNQSPTMSVDYAGAQLAQTLSPVNDDALVHNDVTLTNYDGYASRTFLQNGGRSLQDPPNGVGTGYEYTRSVNAYSQLHSAVDALGSQILNCGTTFENRYPTMSIDLARVTTAGLFSKAPSMRQGDYLQVINMPSFMGGGTEKQLVWGRTETLSNFTWKFDYNTIPELPWESSFNPGTSAFGQVPGAAVSAASSSSVAGSQIAEGAIIGLNVATGTIAGGPTGNIANATITAGNIATATIVGGNIATGTITSTNIADATITGTDIGLGVISGANIASATITGGNIGSATITGSNIASTTITATNIASATITGTQIATGTITASNITNATITGTQIATGTITASNITNATITSSQISSSAGITGGQIASGTIAAANITNATITNTQIAGGTITGSNIGSGTITGANLTNATITSVQISNGTITTTQISNTANITGTQVASGTITASNIAANTITAGQIAASTITATQIAANTITAGKLVGGIVIAGVVNGTTITGANFIADGTSGQILVYDGTPEGGNLVGSWSGVGGSDSFGNTWVAGLTVTQGVITGTDIDNTTITNSTIQGDILEGSTITNANLSGGTITETEIQFDQSGGQLLVYTTGTTTVTQTANGDYTWTAPAGVVTAAVTVIGAGAGGDGGSTSQGGNGGGGGQCSANANYGVNPGQVYAYTVGLGGIGNSTGNGHGVDGGDSFFDNTTGIYAVGGNGNGTPATGNNGTGTFWHTGGGGGNGASAGGAGSGGNSANASLSTGTGNSGITATTSTGGARPSTQSGSGQGGVGGNSAGNGGNASAPGAGGGGAGKGSATGGIQTKSYSPTWVGSYYGPDGGSPNNLRSTTTMYHGGETASGGGFNGNQRSVFRFNTSTITSDFSGWTVTGCTLTLTNEHCYNNSGMNIEFDCGSTLIGASRPSTFPSGVNELAHGGIAEGDTHTYSFNSTVAGFFSGTGPQTDIWAIGANVHTEAPYNTSYYGYFSPTVTLTVTGTKSVAGTTNAGNGADGQVSITYASSQVLVAAVSPASGTDQYSNAYVGGISSELYQLYGVTNPATLTVPANSAIFYGTTNGTPSYKTDSGIFGQLPLTKCDIGQNTHTGTGFGNLTTTWGIPANDSNIGTIYRLTAFGTGTCSTTPATMGFQINGWGGNNTTAEFPSSAVSGAYTWHATATVSIVTTGGAGTAYFSLKVDVQSATAGGASWTTLGRSGGTVTIDTTSSTTMSLQGGWSAGSTSTVLGNSSVFERLAA